MSLFWVALGLLLYLVVITVAAIGYGHLLKDKDHQ